MCPFNLFGIVCCEFGMIEFNRAFWLAFSAFILMAFLSVKLAFLFLGVYFLVTALFLKYQFTRLKNWIQVDGTVLEKRIEKDCSALEVIGNRGSCSYFLYIKYRYEIDGKKNYSTEVSLFKNDFFTPDKKALEQRVRKIKRNQSVTVYIDPSKTKSVLFVEMFSGSLFYFYFNLLLGITVVIAGLMMEF